MQIKMEILTVRNFDHNKLLHTRTDARTHAHTHTCTHINNIHTNINFY